MVNVKYLHIDFIPFTTGSKRGLSTRVSLKQALADQGITGEGRSLTERDLWVQKEKEALGNHRNLNDILFFCLTDDPETYLKTVTEYKPLDS